jgi:hypothetical protein
MRIQFCQMREWQQNCISGGRVFVIKPAIMRPSLPSPRCLIISSLIRTWGLSYIRLNKHYVHLPYLFLGLAEALLLSLAAIVAQQFVTFLSTGTIVWDLVPQAWLSIVLFAVILSCCTLSMGVYIALVREGYASMVLRT